ncbi:MAG: T9SS type A sorting domain-containing protein, partial [Flavobacterium sp.]|nr:T9SS type A sorting domain-containing protein [Flavobacterium sp.]
WEVVPSVAREMNFSLVVRDNATGGGNSARDDMKVTTVDITPFTVDGPSTNEEWLVGSNQTLNWVVGATDQAPVNTQNVTILLSTDGGVTFPITLAANTPNDGSEAFVVPNNTTSSARIMIAAVDNIFYNVNSTNFTISEATASIKDVSFEGFNLYPNPSNGNFNLQFETASTAPVKLQLFDLTGRLVREMQFSNVAARFSESISFKNTAKGLYLLKIKNGSKQTTRKLVIE